MRLIASPTKKMRGLHMATEERAAPIQRRSPKGLMLIILYIMYAIYYIVCVLN
jgi:hypothetical protein